MSVFGGTVFGYMFDVLAWGFVVSLVSFALAFFAEGRGSHTIRLLLRGRPRKEALDVFANLERDEGDWRLVGRLSDIDRESAGSAGREAVGSYRR